MVRVSVRGVSMVVVHLEVLVVLVLFYISGFRRRVFMMWLGRHDHIGPQAGCRKAQTETTECIHQKGKVRIMETKRKKKRQERTSHRHDILHFCHHAWACVRPCGSPAQLQFLPATTSGPTCHHIHNWLIWHRISPSSYAFGKLSELQLRLVFPVRYVCLIKAPGQR